VLAGKKSKAAHSGFVQRETKRSFFTVGAVYDRAIFASEWDKSAVTDRAYSKKWHSIHNKSVRISNIRLA
jgi:hypothetical protein